MKNRLQSGLTSAQSRLQNKVEELQEAWQGKSVQLNKNMQTASTTLKEKVAQLPGSIEEAMLDKGIQIASQNLRKRLRRKMPYLPTSVLDALLDAGIHIVRQSVKKRLKQKLTPRSMRARKTRFPKKIQRTLQTGVGKVRNIFRKRTPKTDEKPEEKREPIPEIVQQAVQTGANAAQDILGKDAQKAGERLRQQVEQFQKMLRTGISAIEDAANKQAPPTSPQAEDKNVPSASPQEEPATEAEPAEKEGTDQIERAATEQIRSPVNVFDFLKTSSIINTDLPLKTLFEQDLPLEESVAAWGIVSDPGHLVFVWKDQ